MMPDTTTTKAPVGPPIWTHDPPQTGDELGRGYRAQLHGVP